MHVQRDFRDPRLVRLLETVPEDELALMLADPDDPVLEACIARSVEEARKAFDPEDGMSAGAFLAACERGEI